MSDYSDRLDRIRAGRDKTYKSIGDNEHMRNSLPRMHRDLYWLLEIVEAYDELIVDECIVTAANIKMSNIMGWEDDS